MSAFMQAIQIFAFASTSTRITGNQRMLALCKNFVCPGCANLSEFSTRSRNHASTTLLSKKSTEHGWNLSMELEVIILEQHCFAFPQAHSRLYQIFVRFNLLKKLFGAAIQSESARRIFSSASTIMSRFYISVQLHMANKFGNFETAVLGSNFWKYWSRVVSDDLGLCFRMQVFNFSKWTLCCMHRFLLLSWLFWLSVLSIPWLARQLPLPVVCLLNPADAVFSFQSPVPLIMVGG